MTSRQRKYNGYSLMCQYMRIDPVMFDSDWLVVQFLNNVQCEKSGYVLQ